MARWLAPRMRVGLDSIISCSALADGHTACASLAVMLCVLVCVSGIMPCQQRLPPLPGCCDAAPDERLWCTSGRQGQRDVLQIPDATGCIVAVCDRVAETRAILPHQSRRLEEYSWDKGAASEAARKRHAVTRQRLPHFSHANVRDLQPNIWRRCWVIGSQLSRDPRYKLQIQKPTNDQCCEPQARNRISSLSAAGHGTPKQGEVTKLNQVICA